jgi:hypothetical protein
MRHGALLLLVGLMGCGAEPGGDPELDQTPTGRGLPRELGPAKDDLPVAAEPPIRYHGGPVMLGTVHLYYIWYGDWSRPERREILTNLARNLDRSPYFRTNTTYYDGAGRYVSGRVALAGEIFDPYSQGQHLGTYGVRDVVLGAIDAGQLPLDVGAFYLVLTSADVTEPYFCDSAYAWHDKVKHRSRDIKFGFAGNTDQCPSWHLQRGGSPNDDPGVDDMAGSVTHELSETVNDPVLSAWYDRTGEESADKCQGHFGSIYTVANGSRANMRFGRRDYYIEGNWVNETPKGRCATAYPAVAEASLGSPTW